MKKIKFKNKKVIIGVIIVLVVIFFVIKPFLSKDNQEVKIETEEITKRTIAQSIGATGTVTTATSKNVVSTLTGMKITSVNVKEGDKINVGDVICTFDTSTIEDSLNSLRKSASVAQAQGILGVQSAQRNLNETIINSNKQLATSQDDVNKALDAYNKAEGELNTARQNISNLEGTVNALRQKLSSVNSKYEPVKKEYEKRETEYNNAKSSLEIKQASFNHAQIAYEQYIQEGGNSGDTANAIVKNYKDLYSEVSAATIALNTANSNYLTYQSTYNSISAEYSKVAEEYQNAEAGLNAAKATVNALEGTTSSLKATYEATVNAYNTVENQTKSSINAMQDTLTNSELGASISTDSQNIQIKAYEKQLKEKNLKSTVSGTVTSVNVKKDDIYTGTTIVTIEGCEHFIVEAQIDEYDIADIEEGMKVLVKTDATRDEELEGRITYVASSATSAMTVATAAKSINSSATYKVQIDLLSSNDRLRLGMNAKLSIITAFEEDVWSVPYTSVYERDDGTKYIEILKNEETQEKEELDVRTGIEGSYYVQIKSDKLKDGMKVVLPEVKVDNSLETLLNNMGADAGI